MKRSSASSLISLLAIAAILHTAGTPSALALTAGSIKQNVTTQARAARLARRQQKTAPAAAVKEFAAARTVAQATLNPDDLKKSILDRVRRSLPDFSSSSASSVSSSTSKSSVSSVSSSKSSSVSSASSVSSVSSRRSSVSSVSSVTNADRRIVELVNQERAKQGLPALTTNTLLERSALKHAKDMVNRNFFDHVNPDGESPTDRIRAEGYPDTQCGCRTYFGENIAKGQRTPEEVMRDWMNSPGHKANILNKNFKEIGIGIQGTVWVQNFGGVWNQ